LLLSEGLWMEGPRPWPRVGTRTMGRTIFDWFIVTVCVAVIVVAVVRPIDPTRRILMIGASVFIGTRRVASLLER